MNTEPHPEMTGDSPSPSPSASPEPKPAEKTEPRRLFIHEPGWRVALKIGSVKSFCYQMAPGQDYYHRLLDGEVYLHHGDERLCIACAERRGLLTHAAKGLRPMEYDADIGHESIGPEGEIELRDGDEGNRFL